MPTRTRLLGFAFATADLLLELRPDGGVELALGAGPSPGVGTHAFQGRPVYDRIDAASGDAVSAAIAQLKPGARFGPIDILMTCGPGRG
ncbi:hypothetical protein BH10PSE2_BH10PSE2_23820 [soil metagenome]